MFKFNRLSKDFMSMFLNTVCKKLMILMRARFMIKLNFYYKMNIIIQWYIQILIRPKFNLKQIKLNLKMFKNF